MKGLDYKFRALVNTQQSPILKSKVPRPAYAEGSPLQANQVELSFAGRRMGVIFLDLGTGLSALLLAFRAAEKKYKMEQRSSFFPAEKIKGNNCDDLDLLSQLQLQKKVSLRVILDLNWAMHDKYHVILHLFPDRGGGDPLTLKITFKNLKKSPEPKSARSLHDHRRKKGDFSSSSQEIQTAGYVRAIIFAHKNLGSRVFFKQ